MIAIPPHLRSRLDRAGVGLSMLCAVHCVAGLVLVSLLGIGGGVLLDPRIHEIGLSIAIVIGALGLGTSVLRHRRIGILLAGLAGLSLMALGLVVPDGPREAAVTIAGVALLAAAHIRNIATHHHG